MRYGDWFTKVDGSVEHRLPVFFILASNDLQKLFPDIMKYLQHNTGVLVSKLDMHTTL
jgi:hypothetical protein